MNNILNRYMDGNLILQIITGMVLGIIIAMISGEAAMSFSILGSLFVGALKAIAPILVFVLIATAIATKDINSKTNIKPIVLLYIAGTFLAALSATIASYIFPVGIILADTVNSNMAPPQSVIEVLKVVVLNMVDNPVNAMVRGNYIGVLTWAVAAGVALRHASDATKAVLKDMSDGMTKVIKGIIRLAPFGIFGIVAETFAQTGFGALVSYGKLLVLLVGVMAFVALVINPLLVYIKTKSNPYPLIFLCLRQSGITAFFTRSSAANIPVNLALCKKMGLNENTYSISIPLGATINMAGAAVTITILTLATVHTLGISVDLPTALLLSFVATITAAGASGVAGGSLLLIPLACGLFGISDNIAMQVVAVGFLIGVVQDSVETALNSSTDVVFTAATSSKELSEVVK